MQNPSFNFRGIKLDGSHFVATDRVLCERCHHPVCSDYAALRCEDYSSALKFKPPLRGFDKPSFNTFRLGGAWAKRLRVGSIVALIDSKTDSAFAHARVTDVKVGNKHEMARLYGKDNHTMQALNVTTDIEEAMLKRLKATSGSMIYNSTDTATVIYLEKIAT